MKKAVIDCKNNVWGIGLTEDEAFNDADQEFLDMNLEIDENLRCVDISDDAYEYIIVNGGCWDEISNELSLDHNKITFKSSN